MLSAFCSVCVCVFGVGMLVLIGKLNEFMHYELTNVHQVLGAPSCESCCSETMSFV